MNPASEDTGAGTRREGVLALGRHVPVRVWHWNVPKGVTSLECGWRSDTCAMERGLPSITYCFPFAFLSFLPSILYRVDVWHACPCLYTWW